ncbi:amidohydrolase [Euzebya sp.]|uniref:amidohydrolase n=1 Tax=Euzebya sp. TaxID=1971409 RepID=UPI00351470A1
MGVDASDRDEPLLLVGADVVTLDDAAPSARAVLIRRRRIAWVGDDPSDVTPPGCRVLDLTGTTLQPAFVNAHTHLTNLGLMLSALDLGVAESVEDCLAAVRANVDVTPDPVLWGIGWDETRWPEHRAPTADELTVAAEGRPAMLSRSDGHCVVVDRTSLTALPLGRARGVDRGSDGRPTGLLRQEAAQVAQRWFVAQLPSATLRHARRLAVRELAASGVASAHEMGGPHRMGPDDFDAWLAGDWPIEVVAYWGDVDLDFVAERGLRRIGGSLLLDGSIGSHSAALASPYADKSGAGQLYHDTEELSEFALQATRKGIQVALHAMGDRAIGQAIDVFESVAAAIGPEQLRRTCPRLEYAALVDAADVRRLAALGVVVTAQPANDLDLATVGGTYERRLGADRARAANPLGVLQRAGVPLAFGSDDVQALDPWATVRSAASHPEEGMRMDATAALRAATLGGRLAARQPMVGAIRAGNRADLAAFEGTPAAPGQCVLTTVAGRVVHGLGLLSYA